MLSFSELFLENQQQYYNNYPQQPQQNLIQQQPGFIQRIKNFAGEQADKGKALGKAILNVSPQMATAVGLGVMGLGRFGDWIGPDWVKAYTPGLTLAGMGIMGYGQVGNAVKMAPAVSNATRQNYQQNRQHQLINRGQLPPQQPQMQPQQMQVQSQPQYPQQQQPVQQPIQQYPQQQQVVQR